MRFVLYYVNNDGVVQYLKKCLLQLPDVVWQISIGTLRSAALLD